MLMPEIEYARPTTVDEALDLLATHDNARALAGGQTLINVLKLRLLGPERVVDITKIDELKGVRTLDDGNLEIGATTTYAELTEAVDVWAVRPIVAEVAAIIADVQVRNRGTIGGNACLNLPTSHFPPVLVAIGAELTIAGAEGERIVPASEFFESTFTTAVRTGELLTRIRIPARRPWEADMFAAMGAGKESKSIVHVATSLRLDGAVAEASVVVGCVSPRPVRATAVEERLVGTQADEAAVRAAVKGVGASLTPVSDVNASGDFKRHVAEVLVERAVLACVERARRGAGG
jgi:aerobic carbon-monoxide dehydrogenase medium subunit